MLLHIGFWCVVDLSALSFLISSSLHLSKHINMDPFSFHLISELVRLAGLDQSVLIEPDSTFPVGVLNKLLQLCLTPHLLSLPSHVSHFPLHLFSFRPSVHLFISSSLLIPLTKGCLVSSFICTAPHNLTVIMCFEIYNKHSLSSVNSAGC